MIALHAKSAVIPPVHNPDLLSAQNALSIHPSQKNALPARPRTLIADDDPGIVAALQILLGNNGYELETVSSPAAVLETVRRSHFDVVLMDLNYTRDTTSGREGLDLVSRVHALDPALPIVVMTGWGTVDLAVEAMRLGVCDFVQKPWDNSRLLKTLHKQVKHARARRNVQRRLAGERKREAQLERELIEARELQENLLAGDPSTIEGLQVSIKWQPATTVGGDYIAAFKIDDNQAALCVADISGKGLPAALLMANFQATLKSLISQRVSPAEVSTQLNEVLYANIPLHKFVTAFYAVVNIPERTLTFTNAGHNPPLLVRSDGECVRLDAGGSVLGAFPNLSFTQEQIELRDGDRLALFTDGLTEACDASGEQFGEHQLIQLLLDHRNLSVTDLKQTLFGAVEQFCGYRFRDDAALMVVGV
jgi:sigma-B regulation protein RsbU (phosphoserine phosphatase)